MTTSMYFPGPRAGLDEGSLAELAQDCRDIELDVAAPRPRVASSFGRIDVPEDASALVDGLSAYIDGLSAYIDRLTASDA